MSERKNRRDKFIPLSQEDRRKKDRRKKPRDEVDLSLKFRVEDVRPYTVGNFPEVKQSLPERGDALFFKPPTSATVYLDIVYDKPSIDQDGVHITLLRTMGGFATGPVRINHFIAGDTFYVLPSASLPQYIQSNNALVVTQKTLPLPPLV